MFKIMYATFCAILLQLCLQGCSPVYKTNYIYHPVKSPQANVCVNQCLDQKQTCNGHSLELQRQCEREANRLAVASDLIKNQSDTTSTISSNRTNLLNDCYKHADQGELSCNVNHKLCHENCGGEVTVQTICVKNCNKIK